MFIGYILVTNTLKTASMKFFQIWVEFYTDVKSSMEKNGANFFNLKVLKKILFGLTFFFFCKNLILILDQV